MYTLDSKVCMSDFIDCDFVFEEERLSGHKVVLRLFIGIGFVKVENHFGLEKGKGDIIT